jgi:hypothetical protein
VTGSMDDILAVIRGVVAPLVPGITSTKTMIA